jgi:hypothetical protein
MKKEPLAGFLDRDGCCRFISSRSAVLLVPLAAATYQSSDTATPWPARD